MTREVSMFLTDKFGNKNAEIPNGSLQSISWNRIGERGSASFLVSPLDPSIANLTLVKDELQVWLDGECSWWGHTWGINGNPAGLTVSAKRTPAYLQRRAIDRTSIDFDSIEQFAIGAALILYAQDESVQGNRDLNIDIAAYTDSGVIRSPRYNRDEHAYILDLLDEFPAMSHGFDWDIVESADGTQKIWTPYYPIKGDFKPEFRMEYSKEGSRYISDFTYDEDATQLVTEVYFTGGTNGVIKFEQHYESLTASETYGLMQGIRSDGSQEDLGWLLNKATREVDEFGAPLKTPVIQSIETETDELLGVLTSGDYVPVVIDFGRIQVQDFYRIGEVTWFPSGAMTFELAERVVVYTDLTAYWDSSSWDTGRWG